MSNGPIAFREHWYHLNFLKHDLKPDIQIQNFRTFHLKISNFSGISFKEFLYHDLKLDI